ncbi:hypothetical protein HPB50_015977 [Hyalomma asiaticum]|uniref:Uncharacterized protein n=1 Tax=Hyalomma asiaticum TaxID=266040 RepID=A0ACB7RUZ7_HYAAI|nr:hypothetical protein HPB50_015977 [Hyalomma asiaticum]
MGQKMGKQRSADITPAPKDKVKRRKSKREAAANGDTQGTITPTGDGVVAAATAVQNSTQTAYPPAPPVPLLRDVTPDVGPYEN